MTAHTADTRLASYGTLAPGRENEHQLAALTGTWRKGVVYGILTIAKSGVHIGNLGITLDPDGDPVEVYIFESADLPDHWARLDAFEGEGYRREITTASTEHGDIEVSIYALAD